MYLDHWQLNILPFENVPNPSFFYYSPKHEEALERLSYAVSQGMGAAMVIGDIGCGKTMLSRMLIKQLTAGGYQVAAMTNPALAPLDFLQMVMVLFQVDCDHALSKPLMWHALEQRLQKNLKRGKGSVLIIDEAQVIEEAKTLDELRMLLNLQSDNRFLLNVILLGQPELEAKVRRSGPLDQRIAVRYRLHPLSFTDSIHYIKHRLNVAGFKRRPFTWEAVKVIVDYGRGIPREVNKLCDRSLLATYLTNKKTVTPEIVQQAWQDLTLPQETTYHKRS